MTEQDFSNMTAEQRLKQIEIIMATAGKKITENAEGIQELKEQGLLLNLQLTRLSHLLTDTISTIARAQERADLRYQQHQAEIQRSQAEIQRSQAEIQRSQAEIERIWQYLMSRSVQGNTPS